MALKFNRTDQYITVDDESAENRFHGKTGSRFNSVFKVAISAPGRNIFDCLSYKDKSLIHLPLIERKKLVEKAVPKSNVIKYSDHVEEAGVLTEEGILRYPVFLGLQIDKSAHETNQLEIIATLTQERLPEITTTERRLNKRKGRIYLDHLQNKKGQTLASVYSARPKPGATVSTPLQWKEVKHGLHPFQFNIFNLEKRLKKTGDLFSGVLKEKIDLRKCLKSGGLKITL